MENLSESAIKEHLQVLPGWAYQGQAIQTSLKFSDFKEAFSKMTQIAFECEALNHHPDWSNVYNQLHIRLNTHDSNGVTEKDIALAKRINKIIHQD